MDGVKLQDRVDTKYVFAHRDLNEVLAAIMPDYRVLEVEGVRGHGLPIALFRYARPETASAITTTDVCCGTRCASASTWAAASVFLEVKRKTGRGRTDKVRIAVCLRSRRPFRPSRKRSFAVQRT